MEDFSEEQAYIFATTGMLVVRDFYSLETVERMLKSVDFSNSKGLYIDKDPQLFMEFMSHPWIVDCCSRLIGPWFRFDHELAVVQTKETPPYLHGGQFGSQGTCTHHPIGKYSWNGQLTVGLSLTGQDEETGGFSYIPGSQNCDVGGQFAMQHSFWKNLLNDPEVVRTPNLRPGDLYVFSEALIHGQKQWECLTPRTTLYIKYVPGYMVWQDYEITKRYLRYASTPTQNALLTRPYTREGDFDNKDFRQSVRRAK